MLLAFNNFIRETAKGKKNIDFIVPNSNNTKKGQTQCQAAPT
jgi:hypothetical protein